MKADRKTVPFAPTSAPNSFLVHLKKRIDYKGLKFKNWMYLMIFSVLILAVLWVLQFAFLNTFYQSMKLNEIKHIGDQVLEEYNTGNFVQVLNEYAFKNNLRIIMLDENGNVINSFDGFNAPSGQFNSPFSRMRMMLPQSELENIQKRFAQSKDERIHYLSSNRQNVEGNPSDPPNRIMPGNLMEMSQAVYVAKVQGADNTQNYLYVSSSIPPIDSTISVLRTQFIIITVILFVLSAVAAQIIARKMSKPIIQLTKSAEKMAKGNLNVDFYDKGYTEIHQLASTLSYATEELRGLDHYRKEFIANVSHDLKTPLTIIKFYGEMIKDVSGNNPERREAHCDTIVKEADWLSGMVNEILELSKLESNSVELTKMRVNISGCLAETLSSFAILAEKEGYIFETHMEKNLWVNANEPYIKRVLYNLISNAVNYTGADKRVIISLRGIQDTVRFEVTDTGVGIPEERLKSIWDRYYKSNETHKRAVVGTGLGLSIVKNALELHGAAYGVISTPGQGSTFWFAMPQCFLQGKEQMN